MIYALEGNKRLEDLVIGIIGAGNMGEALISSLLECGHRSSGIIASRRSDDELDKLRSKYNIRTTRDNQSLIDGSDIVIFGVKPQSLAEVLSEIRAMPKDKLYVSIAAGKSIDMLSSYIGNDRKIARAMPNMALKIGKSATAYVVNDCCQESDSEKIEYIFSRGGTVFSISEDMMLPITVAACMPGWIAKTLGAYESGLLEIGLDTKQARMLISSTLEMMSYITKEGTPYDAFFMKVASKGGGTEAGDALAVLNGYYATTKSIVQAAYGRFIELMKT